MTAERPRIILPDTELLPINQPDFPSVDLTDDNLSRLKGLLLIEPTLLDTAHDTAERISLYRTGHQVLRLVAGETFTEYPRIQAVSQGAAIYEAITTLIRQGFDSSRYIEIDHAILATLALNEFRELLGDADNSHSDPFKNLPKLAGIIELVVARYCDDTHAHYAVAGATAALHLEQIATIGDI
jgi:hypothetical protein